MDDQRLDLSSLDRHGDPVRYRQRVSALAAAALAPAPRPQAMNSWRKGCGVVAVGAILAVATWLPVWSSARQQPAATSRSVDPVLQVAAWAQAGAIPTDANLLAIAGVPDVR
jgi:hypothetical protein